ncbi:DUF917 domain-containing protein [Streptococcus saliviloxodontae]|uniref:DUF917 family protein n=1 Tax=Streptococcus saliviloxodontae TaxID=1349416 RepID=A0ABS2PJR5_9STRE|nr:DUF917 family protein [Streptococcus saliviloxodontae]MBM7635675.1 DUF917 family protein [Streptococcus saliviloxodontae]
MTIRYLTKEDVLAACLGGSVYASGGGGFYEHGLEMGTAAVTLSPVKLISIDELDEDDLIITQTAIGAPGGTTDWQMLGKDYIRAVELLIEKHPNPEKIKGIMTPQNGKSSSTNGWLAAAALGLAVVDATGDIRAHPTGKMGNMGVANDLSYQTIQAVSGGRWETGRHIELVVEGTAAYTSKILRIASDLSGGFIAAARHPLTAKYIKENAVLGGLSRAINLGYTILKNNTEGAATVVDAIIASTQGEILGKGKVVEKEIVYTDEAFDIGKIVVDTGTDFLYIHVQNEYMAVENDKGERLSTYPDVITLFRSEDAHALSNNEVEVGQEVTLTKIDKHHFPLSSGVTDPTVYPEVEDSLGIELYRYSFGK